MLCDYTFYLDFSFLFKWGWRIKARTSRSGSLPFSLLQGCREISRMQPLGPVYIPTLSVSRIPEGPATFHLANQPPCWSGGLGLRSFQRHPKPAALLQSRVCPWFVGKASVLASRVIHSLTGPNTHAPGSLTQSMLVTSWTARYTGGNGHNSKPSDAARWQRAMAWCGVVVFKIKDGLPRKRDC